RTRSARPSATRRSRRCASETRSASEVCTFADALTMHQAAPAKRQEGDALMWATLIVLSALAGVVCGWVLPGRRAVAWGGAIPWLGVLAWLLYNEYFVPSPGGGAS